MKRVAILLSIVFVIALTACTNSNNNTASNSGNESKPEIEAETELIITATNYSFDQEEYHLKKVYPSKLFLKTIAAIMASLSLNLNSSLIAKKHQR